jgi:hypothetical protein
MSNQMIQVIKDLLIIFGRNVTKVRFATVSSGLVKQIKYVRNEKKRQLRRSEK